jgi:hypothetical protein
LEIIEGGYWNYKDPYWLMTLKGRKVAQSLDKISPGICGALIKGVA